MTNVGMAASEKRADKPSKSVIMIEVEVDSCNADAAIFCPGDALRPKTPKPPRQQNLQSWYLERDLTGTRGSKPIPAG